MFFGYKMLDIILEFLYSSTIINSVAQLILLEQNVSIANGLSFRIVIFSWDGISVTFLCRSGVVRVSASQSRGIELKS